MSLTHDNVITGGSSKDSTPFDKDQTKSDVNINISPKTTVDNSVDCTDLVKKDSVLVDDFKDSNSQWYDVEKVLACKNINGVRHYKILWAVQPRSITWEPECNLSDKLKHDYHLSRTLTGRVRKRRR